MALCSNPPKTKLFFRRRDCLITGILVCFNKGLLLLSKRPWNLALVLIEDANTTGVVGVCNHRTLLAARCLRLECDRVTRIAISECVTPERGITLATNGRLELPSLQQGVEFVFIRPTVRFTIPPGLCQV